MLQDVASNVLQEFPEADVCLVWGKAHKSCTDLEEVEPKDNLEDEESKESGNFPKPSVGFHNFLEHEIHLTIGSKADLS